MIEKKVRTFAAFLVIALIGCKGTALDTDDGFSAGRWELEAWFESAQGSTQGHADNLTDTVNLTQQDASYPPAAVFFSKFYHGERDWSDVSFRGGRVGGSLHWGSTDVPLSGSYARDHFLVRFDFKGTSQVVEGKLVDHASGQG